MLHPRPCFAVCYVKYTITLNECEVFQYVLPIASL